MGEFGVTINADIKDEERKMHKTVVSALSCIAPNDSDVILALQASLNDPENQVRQAVSFFLKSFNNIRE